MEINKKKDKLQQSWASLFLKSPTLRHSMIIATGVGKSRFAMLVMEALENDFDEFRILVDNTRLRDFNWKEDFIKWGKEELFKKVQLFTYQAAYRWNPKELDLSKVFILGDEVDFVIGTPEYGKFFTNFPKVKMLGVTGYVAKNKRAALHKVLPILVDYPHEQAVAEGVINDMKFIFVKYELDKDPKGIHVKYRKNGAPAEFYQSENAAYDYATTAFNKAYAAYQIGLNQKLLFMMNSNEFSILEKRMHATRNKRKNLLYSGIASKRIAKQVIDSILVESDKSKVVVFSKFTKQVSAICKHTYHNKNTTKINDSNYDAFNAGDIRVLGICDKINRGVNMIGLNNLVVESCSSSDTVIRQRVGRAGRLDVSETAYIYILIPYYMKKVGNQYEQAQTQMATWVKKMLEGYDLSKAEVIDKRIVKEIK